MAVRFTEYLKHKGRELALYIVQETNAGERLGFKIHVKGGGDMMFAAYKEPGERWKFIPHTIPQIVKDFQFELIARLEQQMARLQQIKPGGSTK